MGYANDAMVGGQWRPVASQFLKIGSKDGADMKLGELVPGGTWAPASDSIKVLEEHTAVKFQATYFTWATIPPKQQNALIKKGINESNFVNGWYKQIDGAADWDQNMNDELLPFGTAILAVSTGANTYFTSNGEVVQLDPGDKIQVSLVGGQWKFIANCTPVNLKLGDFVPAGTWAPASDSIKVLEEHTAVKFQATYFTWATIPPKQQNALIKKGINESNFVSGWYKQIDGAADWDQNMNNEDVLAGQGFLAVSTGTETVITLPPAL